MRLGLRQLGVVVVLVVLTACGTGESSSRSAGSVPDELRFTATTLDGETFSGESLAGKPAVLWFWAPWCPVCQFEASFIADMAKAHGDEATFVGVASRDNVAAMKQFTKRYSLKFTQINDADGAVWARFGVTAQPAMAFISADGTIEMVRGTTTEQEITHWLETRAQP